MRMRKIAMTKIKETKANQVASSADKSSDQLVRLQKFIADCGVTSRRKAELLITEGKVRVNGRVIDTLGAKINPETDVVQIDQKFIQLESVNKIYLVMNKPRAVMTTVSDPEGRKTVMDLIPNIPQRVYPVGRLDYLSEGLLILTNDGDFANIVMHPKHEITKLYEVKVFGVVTEAILAALSRGVKDRGELLKPLYVKVIGQLKNKTWLEFRLAEGKNRELRRLCESVGLTVDKLRRVAIEGINIQNLPVGHVEFYTKKEMLRLLGIDEEGKKIKQIKTVSIKKAVDVKKLKIKVPTAKVADSREFKRYRKDLYYKVLQVDKNGKANTEIDSSTQKPKGRKESIYSKNKKIKDQKYVGEKKGFKKNR